ncbi:molybdenum cofactor guanylyltransferase [Cellulomonas marina]|uniref:Molybdopterin-guanine dinucleotide biosynthesis protein A n=1 Tax=Cellulomonas marina TaxID=988821 RepID=A0A1I0ZG68_9CELL|nr:NTP transferase domain-containing protein [Cellulomonas marina]GIG28551.1 hypothetical protein Cma02nite_11510 [Cellulomonas marina]SFB24645.1 Molybdopterin-guanine dinucleotide biosynthesis protein A [Cellulomonas marina]
MAGATGDGPDREPTLEPGREPGRQHRDVLVVVTAGGTGGRLGGVDKVHLPLTDDGAGPSLLDALVAALPPVPVVVVGPHGVDGRADVGGRTVLVAREDPPGGGPLAGVAAGLSAGLARGPAAPAGSHAVLVVLAGDQPWAGPVVPRLLAALGPGSRSDAAVGVDATGRRQPLLAAYRLPAVAALLAGHVHDRPARLLLEGLQVVEVPLAPDEALDVDTPADLARARTIARHRPRPPEEPAPGD